MTPDYLSRITSLLSPPSSPVARPTEWTGIEDHLGVSLPSDYRRYVETYGAGVIMPPDIWAWNPSYPTFPFDEWKVIRFTDEFIYPYGDDDVDLFSRLQSMSMLNWGASNYGHSFFWVVEGRPDEWPVLVGYYGRRFCVLDDCTMSRCIAELLARESPLFPDYFTHELFNQNQKYTFQPLPADIKPIEYHQLRVLREDAEKGTRTFACGPIEVSLPIDWTIEPGAVSGPGLDVEKGIVFTAEYREPNWPEFLRPIYTIELFINPNNFLSSIERRGQFVEGFKSVGQYKLDHPSRYIVDNGDLDIDGTTVYWVLCRESKTTWKMSFFGSFASTAWNVKCTAILDNCEEFPPYPRSEFESVVRSLGLSQAD